MLKDNLKTLRLKRGLTQTELSYKIDVGKSVISKYENGIISPPFEKIVLIAKVLNAGVEELLYGEPTEKKINSINASALYGLNREYIDVIIEASERGVDPTALLNLVNAIAPKK